MPDVAIFPMMRLPRSLRSLAMTVFRNLSGNHPKISVPGCISCGRASTPLSDQAMNRHRRESYI